MSGRRRESRPLEKAFARFRIWLKTLGRGFPVRCRAGRKHTRRGHTGWKPVPQNQTGSKPVPQD